MPRGVYNRVNERAKPEQKEHTMTEAEKKAKRKYLSKGKRLTIDFYPSEADLIAHIEKQPQKQTYIKNLIRKDIKENEQCTSCTTKSFI